MKEIIRQLALDYLNEIVPAKKFGILLKAKVTPDMKEGVKHKFFLTIEELKQLKETLNK